MSEEKKVPGIPGGDPKDLAAMVQYQEGSIVSRILLQDKSGTLTVFSFDAGQALSEHTVPFNAFLQILDGTGQITVGDTVSDVEAGQIILMPAGIPHSVKAVKQFKMLLTMFKNKVG